MPSFASPKPLHRAYDLDKEKSSITRHFSLRNVPKSQNNRLLLATWNIANLGNSGQDRKPKDLEVIAHILKRFDLTAVQEVNDRFGDFDKVVRNLGDGYDYIMTDTAGNSERLAFVYKKDKVNLRNQFGEIALRPPYIKRDVLVHYTDRGLEKEKNYEDVKFTPFNRNPFIGSFRSGRLNFTLVNVHLYFGKFQDSKKKEDHLKYARRVLEVYALAKWAYDQGRRNSAYDKNIVLLGDMNVPRMKGNESTYKALKRYGMQPLDYLTRTGGEFAPRLGGTNIRNTKTYDQLAFAPGSMGKRVKAFGVFDFERAVFKDLYDKLHIQLGSKKGAIKFNRYIQHHFSDHRPVWVQLRTS